MNLISFILKPFPYFLKHFLDNPTISECFKPTLQQIRQDVCETPCPGKRTIFEKAQFIWVLRLRVKNFTLTFDK